MEPVTTELLVAGAFMMLGVWLHLTERLEHAHDEPVAPGTQHSHWHTHTPLAHSHAHFPDMHHSHHH